MTSAPLIDLLRCPCTGSPLVRRGECLETVDGARRYPIVRGVPILICDDRSAFRIADYERPQEQRGVLETAARRLLALVPGISRNVAARENYAELARLLCERDGPRRVLVVGGATKGEGYEELLAVPELHTVETDASIGPRTQVVCDGHDLPFADGTFDAVVCQAVLEHVADPYRVVSEIHRVLAADGLVYSEIPFMQQVHEGAYDFTRFTQVGHRRLFRHFDVIRMGAQGGPGMALAWSLQYFLLSFGGRSKLARAALRSVASLLVFWLKYLDEFLSRRPAGIDAASGTFLLGSRREEPISDRDVIESYMGAG